MHPGPTRGIQTVSCGSCLLYSGAPRGEKSPDIIHSGECTRADRGVTVVDNQKSILSHSGYFPAVLGSLYLTASVLFLSLAEKPDSLLSRGYAVNFQLIILSSTI